MGFLSVLHSDVGIKKNTNQDSVLIKVASTDYGEVMLAVVCDGMGGLAKGEDVSLQQVLSSSRPQSPHQNYRWFVWLNFPITQEFLLFDYKKAR